jgi:hypothetical protein
MRWNDPHDDRAVIAAFFGPTSPLAALTFVRHVLDRARYSAASWRPTSRAKDILTAVNCSRH